VQQSNLYIVGYALLLTVVLGGGLGVVSLSLKETQKEQVELERKKQILSAVIDTKGTPKTELAGIYDKRITAVVVDIDGEVIKGETADKIDIRKEFKKKDPNDKLLPVFIYKAEDGSEAYILPTYGKGLWDLIWGYVAVDKEFKTVIGVSFDHVGETPGLGARITDAEIQKRYQGKKIADPSGALVPVIMVKGENNKGLNEYQVDGMSGATITANGVNDMLKAYMEFYQGYFKTLAS
jgi:Na+-transporting NADH:ubiquinone oxidoreductase subunit C